MGWLDTMDRALGRLIEAGRWLVLPVALFLFLQWPLRDFVRWGSREANDLGQWIFALYVSAAVTFATRERAHLAVDAIAHDYPARLRGAIARWGALLCVAPWALFMLWPTCCRRCRSTSSWARCSTACRSPTGCSAAAWRWAGGAAARRRWRRSGSAPCSRP